MALSVARIYLIAKVTTHIPSYGPHIHSYTLTWALYEARIYLIAKVTTLTQLGKLRRLNLFLQPIEFNNLNHEAAFRNIVASLVFAVTVILGSTNFFFYTQNEGQSCPHQATILSSLSQNLEHHYMQHYQCNYHCTEQTNKGSKRQRNQVRFLSWWSTSVCKI